MTEAGLTFPTKEEHKEMHRRDFSSSEQNLIKQHLDVANATTRMRKKIANGDFRSITTSDIKYLDPEFQERLKLGAYNQMLRELGVARV